jgi:hypothetical protein
MCNLSLENSRGEIQSHPNIVHNCSKGSSANLSHINSCCQVAGVVGISDNGDLSGGTGSIDA